MLFNFFLTVQRADPCPVGSVLAFLQEYFSMGAAQVTIKVHVVAIAPSPSDGLLRPKLGCISKAASP